MGGGDQQQQAPPPLAAPAEANPAAHVRLPDFWEPNPSLWFLQVEAQFAMFWITTSLAKYHLAVAKLPFETLMTAQDLEETAATINDPYE